MVSSIYLDGAALYIFCFLMVLIVSGGLIVCLWNRKLYREKKQYERLFCIAERQLIDTRKKLYEATFKVLEVDKDV